MDVPIVGQSYQVILTYPTTIIGCRCRGENQVTILVTTGLGNPVECGHCGRLFQATGLDAEGRMQIGIYNPVPTDKVM